MIAGGKSRRAGRRKPTPAACQPRATRAAKGSRTSGRSRPDDDLYPGWWDDGAPDPGQVEEEDRLRDVGQRLLAPPDEARDLRKLLKSFEDINFVDCLLKQEIEKCLLKVDQSPPESTLNAIRPATEALVKKELMGHPDPGVRLDVASCISEITRITAPYAPYDDDAMRDVFSLIVSSFQHLDNIKDPFFRRRVSILDTMAKVRSCVVMLDLECDDLINDMFHHFLRTVSAGHSDAVISCMETIMRLVIEESEDVQPQIALCLLQNVRKEEKESSPSFKLAEKVIGLCHEKLKPVFLQSLKGTSLSDYSQIVSSVCEEGSDDWEHNIVDPSGKEMVDDGKLSERIIPVKPRFYNAVVESFYSGSKKYKAKGCSMGVANSRSAVRDGNRRPFVVLLCDVLFFFFPSMFFFFLSMFFFLWTCRPTDPASAREGLAGAGAEAASTVPLPRRHGRRPRPDLAQPPSSTVRPAAPPPPASPSPRPQPPLGRPAAPDLPSIAGDGEYPEPNPEP
nr:unnamed protein product [Digitaria exilis]